MTDKSPKIIPFGKYKGRLLDEVLVDDPGYLQWLTGQDWFRAKFTILHQVIINRGAEPEETPEHNALQVKFLDDDFRERFLRCAFPELKSDEALTSDAEFEERGVDVVLQTSLVRKEIPRAIHNLFYYYVEQFRDGITYVKNSDYEERSYSIPVFAELRIELKPIVGDDYPAVLRQMKRNSSTVLFLGNYVGTGASEDQFIKTFATAGIRVVFARDVG